MHSSPSVYVCVPRHAIDNYLQMSALALGQNLTPACPRLLDMINDFVLLRF